MPLNSLHATKVHYKKEAIQQNLTSITATPGRHLMKEEFESLKKQMPYLDTTTPKISASPSFEKLFGSTSATP